VVLRPLISTLSDAWEKAQPHTAPPPKKKKKQETKKPREIQIPSSQN